MEIAIDAAAFIGGYVLAALTWDKVHTWIVGAENKIDQLRAKAKALAASLKAGG